MKRISQFALATIIGVSIGMLIMNLRPKSFDHVESYEVQYKMDDGRQTMYGLGSISHPNFGDMQILSTMQLRIGDTLYLTTK